MIIDNHNNNIHVKWGLYQLPATLKGSTGFKICPKCRNENLEVVPVEDHESYKMNIGE
jgi:hypothetical protein